MENRFGVGRCVENGAAHFEFVSHDSGVCKIAVVGYGNLAVTVTNYERLYVSDGLFSSSGIAYVTNGDMAWELADLFLAEYVGNEAQAEMTTNLGAVRTYNACALLPSMLKRMQSQISEI
mmetsp:Transcript_25437/g.42630  ORF Transcript_25437/g.42630 Transcript_25437/m.42630 type:complete len:120 (-) Transcript_25437:394-753(-)